MKGLLQKAQQGDEDAHGQVALYVFNKYKDRVKRFFSEDPALSKEDIEVTFFEGIFRHVPLADGRGDDFYHIGQRGVWAVQSEIRAVAAQMGHRVWLRTPDGESEDPADQLDPASDFQDVVIAREDDRAVARIITGASLKVRSRQLVDAILDDPALDPREPGFNKAVAEKLGVSQQRASQIMGELRAELGDVRP